MSSVHEKLHDFFQCCERLLGSAPEPALLSDEDCKRICFYTNEIAKLTNAQRLSTKSSGKPDA
jgi:hypothetical protein